MQELSDLFMVWSLPLPSEASCKFAVLGRHIVQMRQQRDVEGPLLSSALNSVHCDVEAAFSHRACLGSVGPPPA